MDAAGRWQILRLHVEDKIPLAALARDHSVGLRTLERWHARYRTAGLAGLGSAPRADAGIHRLPADLVSLIEGLALTRPRPPITTIHRTVARICATEKWPAPSYGVVWSIIRALDPAMVTLALEGATAYRDKYELALRRQADRPNAMWQADHTMLDILVVGTDNKPARPWLTAIIDDCSRAICGYTVFLGAPSAMNTALALRQAIWHKADPAWPMCGIPDVLHILRPTVAVDRFITFAALALHQHPQWRDRLRDGEDRDAEMFVQEVRRFYPFFPAVAARVRSAFDWQDVHFPAGRRVLLDLYGTNHHPHHWEDPDVFRPERFATWDGGAYDFIPQGGGDHRSGHRCAGEWVTIAVMKTALTMLTREMRYHVPAQDLRISLRRMPTLPASGLLISTVQHGS